MSKRMTSTEIAKYKNEKRKNLFLTAKCLKRGVLRLKQKPYDIDKHVSLLRENNISPEFDWR